jgi:hypothetical protein
VALVLEVVIRDPSAVVTQVGVATSSNKEEVISNRARDSIQTRQRKISRNFSRNKVNFSKIRLMSSRRK